MELAQSRKLKGEEEKALELADQFQTSPNIQLSFLLSLPCKFTALDWFGPVHSSEPLWWWLPSPVRQHKMQSFTEVPDLLLPFCLSHYSHNVLLWQRCLLGTDCHRMNLHDFLQFTHQISAFLWNKCFFGDTGELVWSYLNLSDVKIRKMKLNESHLVVSESLWPHGLYGPWNSPGQNTGVGSLFFLQGIFPTQGSNPGLPHCRQIPFQLSHLW